MFGWYFDFKGICIIYKAQNVLVTVYRCKRYSCFECTLRDKFDYIMSVFHMVDNNNLAPGDKFAKVHTPFTLLNENFISHACKFLNHSVDKAIVPYFGRQGCKQFIRVKPICWWSMLWVGWSTNGYINWFYPYQVSSTHIRPENEELVQALGLCFLM